MSPMAAELSRDDMIALGNFFAAQKPAPIAFKADGARVAAGKKISDAVLVPHVPSRGLRRAERDPQGRRVNIRNTSGSSSTISRPGAGPTTPET